MNVVLGAVENMVTRRSHSGLCHSCDEQEQGVPLSTSIRSARLSAHDPPGEKHRASE